jgi:hypothetical protein
MKDDLMMLALSFVSGRYKTILKLGSMQSAAMQYCGGLKP